MARGAPRTGIMLSFRRLRRLGPCHRTGATASPAAGSPQRVRRDEEWVSAACPGGPGADPPSDPGDRLQPPGGDRSGELLVVLLVLFGVPLGEVGDRQVETVVLTQVL